MPAHSPPNRSRDVPLECDHCHYPIPGEPAVGDDGQYCSRACLEAADETTLSDPDAYKRIVTGIEPIDSLIPDGIPADSLVLLAGEAGTRRTELLTEFVWRALERGEPAVIVSLADPPIAALERFFENGWNVLPALDDGRLRVVDCFTHRLEDRERYLDARTEWGTFVGETAAEAVVEVTDPADGESVVDAVHATLEEMEMSETGLVTLDSLVELDAVVEGRRPRALLAELRATVCKARYVPTVATTSAFDAGRDADAAPVADAVVDLRLADQPSRTAREARLAVRKVVGTPALPQWVTYGYEPVRGLYALERSNDRSRPTVGDGRVAGRDHR